jgi:glycerophosphoryl diester phosphodiesterase
MKKAAHEQRSRAGSQRTAATAPIHTIYIFLGAIGLIALIASGCVVPPSAGEQAARPGGEPKARIEVQGHRGARGKLPENTLVGFRYALEQGADVLELDLQATKDGHLVVWHDPIIDGHLCVKGSAASPGVPAPSRPAQSAVATPAPRATNAARAAGTGDATSAPAATATEDATPAPRAARAAGPEESTPAAKGAPVAHEKVEIPIRSLTLEELRAYDCGSKKNPRFPDQKTVPGQRIPTLDEVIRMVKKSNLPAARRVRFNIEVKSVPALPELYPSPKQYATLLVVTLRKHDLIGRANIQSFDYRTLEAVRALEPRIPIALLTGKCTTRYVRLLEESGAQIISPHHHWITAADVSRIHAAGGRVIPWTVNEPEDWRRLIEAGVDGIITDYPGRLISFLKAYRERGPVKAPPR